MPHRPSARRLPVRRPLAVLLALVLTVLLVGPAASLTSAASGAAAPDGLRISGLAEPADLGDVTAPTFSWRVHSREQQAYEILVSSSAAKAAAHEGDVWSSGRIASRQQTDVAYGGDELAREQRYFWSVRTWDATGAGSDWSAPTWFGTAPGTTWADSTPIWAAATPLDPPKTTAWKDYTLTAKVKVTAVALGVRFRAADASNSYMWQLRGADNQLKRHVQTSGTYAALDPVALPARTLEIGKTVALRITVAGATIKTWIDDVLVDTTTDATFAQGTIGFRNGGTESGDVDDVRVVDDSSGATLFSDDFSGTNPFTCGTVAAGVLSVGKSAACVLPNPNGPATVTTQWAFLRKQTTLQDKPIAWATAFATGVDFASSKQYVYKLYVNGSFVGLGPTRQVGGETRFDGFDVTRLLQRGQDVTIAAQAYSRASTPKFLAQLRVTYADGTTQTIGTGPDWKAIHGTQILPEVGSIGTSYFTAPKENLDARRFPFGYERNGFDDGAWAAAQAQPAIADLQPAPIGKVQEQLRDPVRIVDKGNGNYFVDFGRTWIGGVQYDVADATEGKTVDLRFGEVPTTTGGDTVKFNLATGNTYQDVLTLKAGRQQLRTWGMRVFRYVEIVGAPEPVTKENLKALALVYPFDEHAASFSSSDPGLDQVYQLSKNTIESLNLNFYTDSWTRERTDYEADGYLQQLSSLYLMEDLSLGRYSMNYFKANRTWPTEWPIYVILAVHDAWQQTGSREQVEDYYDNLKTKLPAAWLEASTGLVRKPTGTAGAGSCNDCDIVDWPTSQRDGYQFRPYNTVVNAIYYRAMRDMAAMAAEIGRDEDAADYTAKADRLRAQINARLYDASAGRYDDGMAADGTPTGHASVHASAFALAFGVPETDQAGTVADYVASRGMACSVYCAAFLVKGLYDGGDGDAALHALTDTGTSSWLHMIELGAGSTMEAWDPSQKSNLTYSHPWAASPAFNVPAGLFGIQPTRPGYDTFRVRPQPGSLEHASVTVPTVKGPIGAALDHGEQGDLRVVADVPGNTRADVGVPTEQTGDVTLYVDGTPRRVTAADGFATARGLVTGCHLVTTEPGDAGRSAPRLTGVCSSPIDAAPTVVSTLSAPSIGGWLPLGTALSLAPAAGADLDAIEYRIGTGSWRTYERPVVLPAGQVAVAVRGVAGGRRSPELITSYAVDGAPPVVTATVADRTLALTAEDAESGVERIELRLDGGAWATYAGPLVLDDAAHAVAYRAVDRVGNVSATATRTVDAVAHGPAPAPIAITAPRLTGTTTVGRVLTVSTGRWTVDGLTTRITWTRDGSPIAGAHGRTLRVQRADAGKRLAAIVTVTRPGFATGTAQAGPTARIGRATSTVGRSLSRSQTTRGSRVTLRLRVRATGVTPTGRVAVYDRGRRVGIVVLRRGSASIAIRPRSRGQHAIKAVYRGDAGVRRASTQILLRVR